MGFIVGAGFSSRKAMAPVASTGAASAGGTSVTRRYRDCVSGTERVVNFSGMAAPKEKIAPSARIVFQAASSADASTVAAHLNFPPAISR